MQHFKTLRNSIGAAAASGLLMAQNVWAEIPADAKSDLQAAKGDGVEMSTIVLGVIIAIFAFKLLRKAL